MRRTGGEGQGEEAWIWCMCREVRRAGGAGRGGTLGRAGVGETFG